MAAATAIVLVLLASMIAFELSLRGQVECFYFAGPFNLTKEPFATTTTTTTANCGLRGTKTKQSESERERKAYHRSRVWCLQELHDPSLQAIHSCL